MVSPVALVAFVAVERRVAHPLLPLAYFRQRNFTFAIATQCFTNFAYMGGFVITPLFLQDGVRLRRAPRSATLMIARPLAFAITGPLAGLRRGAGRGAHARPWPARWPSSLSMVRAVDGRARVVATSSIIGALALSGIGLGVLVTGAWPPASPTPSTSATSAWPAPSSR